MEKNVNQSNVAKPEVDHAVLAQQVAAISDAMRRLLSSGLNRKAVIVLLHDYSNVGKRDIEYVLNALTALKGHYTTIK